MHRLSHSRQLGPRNQVENRVADPLHPPPLSLHRFTSPITQIHLRSLGLEVPGSRLLLSPHNNRLSKLSDAGFRVSKLAPK